MFGGRQQRARLRSIVLSTFAWVAGAGCAAGDGQSGPFAGPVGSVTAGDPGGRETDASPEPDEETTGSHDENPGSTTGPNCDGTQGCPCDNDDQCQPGLLCKEGFCLTCSSCGMCGDGTCDANEDCDSCPMDCTSCDEPCEGTTGGEGCEPEPEPECTVDMAPDGCGSTEQFCADGNCVDCPFGTSNCNGSGTCECQGICLGTSECVECDYNEEPDGCGDDLLWCYQNECRNCTDGFANCDRTRGCECEGTCGPNGTCIEP